MVGAGTLARDETLPRWVPGPMRTLLRPVTHFGTTWFRKVWSHPDLAQEFADLVAYRDQLYARHQRATPVARAS